jgi:L-ascorbate metabolism protein UlaG (beta-lactamase superfamily)
MKVIYLGHAAFMLEGSSKVLIDPYILNNPLVNIDVGSLEPEVILVTHAHHDHLGDAIEISRRTSAPILSTPEVAAYCEEKGGISIAAHMGGEIPLEGIIVKIFPAWHTSSLEGRMLGAPVSFVISMDGRSLYHAGDTALFGDMSLIGEEFDLDLALLPIGGWYTMGQANALRALDLLRPRMVVPMHYDTFERIRADPREFCTGAIERGVECLPLSAGQYLDI